MLSASEGNILDDGEAVDVLQVRGCFAGAWKVCRMVFEWGGSFMFVYCLCDQMHNCVCV